MSSLSTPGRYTDYSAPYQQVYTSFAAAVDLTSAITQAKCSCTGMVVVCTGNGNLVWKDCAGNSNTLALTAGQILDLPFAAKELSASTITGSVVVYWNGR